MGEAGGRSPVGTSAAAGAGGSADPSTSGWVACRVVAAVAGDRGGTAPGSRSGGGSFQAGGAARDRARGGAVEEGRRAIVAGRSTGVGSEGGCREGARRGRREGRRSTDRADGGRAGRRTGRGRREREILVDGGKGRGKAAAGCRTGLVATRAAAGRSGATGVAAAEEPIEGGVVEARFAEAAGAGCSATAGVVARRRTGTRRRSPACLEGPPGQGREAASGELGAARSSS